MRSVMLAAIVSATVAATGCDSGPKLYKVRGTVRVGDKPAADAIVFLHRQGRENPNEQVPYGKCAADGTFSVANGTSGEGALPGDYVLTVVWPDMSKAPDGNGERPDLLAGTYAQPAKSALKVKVEAKDNDLGEVKLNAPPPGSVPAPKSGADKPLK
jgi:hypothetical protein